MIVYVAPTGGRAASAGVFITMAAHVARHGAGDEYRGGASGGGRRRGPDKEMMKKIENDAAAFARTIATERGRNAEWAEKAVRSSVSVTEREAVKLRIVDLVADNLAGPPGQGRRPDGEDGEGVGDAPDQGRAGEEDRGQVPRPVPRPDLRSEHRLYPHDGRACSGSSSSSPIPGVILPGVLGGISLILAFFAFQSLPINWAGLLLILFG